MFEVMGKRARFSLIINEPERARKENTVMNMNKLKSDKVEEMIKTMTHAQIVELRNKLKMYGNVNYLLRSLYYDYDKQCWIEG